MSDRLSGLPRAAAGRVSGALRIAAACALAGCAAGAARRAGAIQVGPVPAPDAPGANRGVDTAALVLRLGPDTGAVDRVTWAGGTMTGAAVVARTMAVAYQVGLEPDGVVGRYAFQLGPEPAVRDSVAFAAPAAGAPATAVSRGRVPFWNATPGLYDVLLRAAYAASTTRARRDGAAAGGAVAVPLFRFGAAHVRDTALVTFAGRDSARVVLRTDGAPDVVLRARVGAGGRLLGLAAPPNGSGGSSYAWTVERAAALPAGAYALAPAYGAPAGAPYAAEEVRLAVGGGITLAGTFVRPLGATGPTPAVVLLHGSTPSDRNNGQRPLPGLFWQLADTLARRGLAVLRYDQRGVGASGGTPDGATVQVRAADARAAVAYLRSRPDIDPAHLAVLGLSEGALAAVLAATGPDGQVPREQGSPVRAVVLISSPGRPGPALSAHQNRVAAERYRGLAGPALDAALAAARAEDDSVLRAVAGGRARGHDAALLAYDPLPAAGRLRVPALVVHGATDLQVPAEDAGRLASAIRAGGNADVTVRVVPGINHVLLADPVGDWRRYLTVPSLVAPGAVRGVVADWLVARLAPARGATGQ